MGACKQSLIKRNTYNYPYLEERNFAPPECVAGGEVRQLGLHGRVVREGDHRHPLAHPTQVRRHLGVYI